MASVTYQHIAKTFRTRTACVQALENLDLCVADGELVAVVGPSGCGKTTLLRLTAGLDDVTSGSRGCVLRRVAGNCPHWLEIRQRCRYDGGLGGGKWELIG